MNSIDTYLKSISSFEEQKKPFSDQIEEIEDHISSIEIQMEELESELSELENEKESQEEELETINRLQKKAYVASLADPKAIILEELKNVQQKGIFKSLKFDFPESDSLVLVTIPFKRVDVSISFPELASALDQYGPLHLVIQPKESTQPWQMKKTIKLMKKYQFLGNLKRICDNKYLLPATLESQSSVVVERLSMLASFANELDGPMTYELNPNETV